MFSTRKYLINDDISFGFPKPKGYLFSNILLLSDLRLSTTSLNSVLTTPGQIVLNLIFKFEFSIAKSGNFS